MRTVRVLGDRTVRSGGERSQSRSTVRHGAWRDLPPTLRGCGPRGHSTPFLRPSFLESGPRALRTEAGNGICMMSAPARKAAVLGHVSGGADAQTQGRARGAPGTEQDVSLHTDSCTFGEQFRRTGVECTRDFRKMFETNPSAVLRGWK